MLVIGMDASHVETELDDIEDCPACGTPQRVTRIIDGAPSMMGWGHDPDVVELECGHTLMWNPLTGQPYVRGGR